MPAGLGAGRAEATPPGVGAGCAAGSAGAALEFEAAPELEAAPAEYPAECPASACSRIRLRSAATATMASQIFSSTMP